MKDISMPTERKRIAVVGCGVAGLTAAWLLQRKHEVHLFEKNDYVGGHTRTLQVPQGPDAGTPVDTGFIVMNHRNYPNFTQLLKQLNIELEDSSMTFSFYDHASKYGYSGNSVSSLFPSFSYLFKIKHLALVGDLYRFARIGYRDLNSGYLAGKTLGTYCDERGFGKAFQENYLYPMGAAIWSSPISEMRAFPAQAYLHFLENHGLLRLSNRPQWRYVKGGSRSYVRAMLQSFKNPPHLNAAPTRIMRHGRGVTLQMQDGQELDFDELVIGAHADEALRLLGDPSSHEIANLGPWRYQPNTVTLHTDTKQLPSHSKLWSSWNFVREAGDAETRPVAVSYYMNRLQNLPTERHYIVTLNPSQPISEDKIINSTTLMHPLYSFESMGTQAKLRSMNGADHTWFCGSYFGYGFHEDAVTSAVEVAQAFGIHL
ncbi:FAD-dependent oxidoreductase [Coraliomargarita algicola]|uniref:FAD-dependent oxidoreductase n=1 Tax=Coraliomargarita algicola TaxID=3092156 RepID=A0ABZ0RHP5_9BACT|nr:FAD-dependent oxidoreductase [Coraliomargarita sp. J2-16]WPJ94540.1 FAD-dependent oxidoreductase [Coraliomargarita sp. J2-16]